jgi:hypothetical protein
MEALLSQTVCAVFVIRGANGYWDHPGIPWSKIPEDESMSPYLQSWGFEFEITELQFEKSDMSEKFWDSDEINVSEWNPLPPEGENWFLASIYDTEDSPCALWLRSSQTPR